MPTLDSQAITLEIPGITTAGYMAFLQSWRVGKGGNPTTAVIACPDLGVSSTSYADSLAVTAYLGSQCIFRGYTAGEDCTYAPGDNAVTLTAYDIRQRLTARALGQFAIGPGTNGGWPGVGFDPVFNPRGRPNRSAALSGAAYTFDSSLTAHPWTYGQILQWLFYYYIDAGDLLINQAYYTTAPLSDVAGELRADSGTPADLLNRLFADLGGTWTVSHLGSPGGASASYLVPLLAGVTAPATRTIHLDGGSTIGTPNRYSASAVSFSRSTLHSFDRVEVHSAKAVVEASYYSTEWSPSAPLLTKVTSSYLLPPGDMAYFDVDVTLYASHHLGDNLASGCRPKPWLPDLVTRRTTAAYQDALDTTWSGTPIPCRETVWLTFDSGSTWKRVKAGVRIDLDNCRVYVAKSGTSYGTTAGSEVPWLYTSAPAGLGILFTVATRTEYAEVQGHSDRYLASARTRKIVRRDLVPTQRYNSYLPSPGSANPSAYTQYAATLETYDSVTAALQAVRDELWRTRSAAEVTVNFTLPFAPEINHGDALTLAPLTLGLTGLRVLDIAVNAETLDMTVRASNNVDFA